MIYDLMIIGCGASGMMAAITAARQNKSVLVLEHMPVSGKKLLATGNGKCNFTNKYQDSSCYRSEDMSFVMSALDRFSAADTIAFFRQIGLLEKDREGYVYPISGQAATMKEVLIREMSRLGVTCRLKVKLQSLIKENDIFHASNGSDHYQARSVILCCGGMASPKSGSDGSGYALAKGFGHTVKTTLPALTPLLTDDPYLKKSAGVRTEANIKLYIQKELVSQDTGELQITDYGVSGIPVFQLSRYASLALEKKEKVSLLLDLFPSMGKEELYDYLSGRPLSVRTSLKDLLNGILNQKLAESICQKVKVSDQAILSMSDQEKSSQLQKLIAQIKQYSLQVKGYKGFEQAQVTCGGIPTAELIPQTFESLLCPGLYLAGEMIDVDAICGGYNLQWAWTSGYLAGLAAASR